MSENKKYIKNGVVNGSDILVTEEGTIFNPTPEMFYERGWQDYTEPTNEQQQTVEQIRAQVISELISFENGTAVRGSYIDDELTWIPAPDRCSYRHGLEALKKQGTTVVTWNGKQVSVDKILEALDTLDAHAAMVTLRTHEHKRIIEGLKTEQELLRYDYTAGYPDIPEINLTLD